jgi:hypothetical protein
MLLAVLALFANAAIASVSISEPAGDCPGSGQTCKYVGDATYVKGLDQ